MERLISGARYNIFNIASKDRLANPTSSHQLSFCSPQSLAFERIASAGSMKIPTQTYIPTSCRGCGINNSASSNLLSLTRIRWVLPPSRASLIPSPICTAPAEFFSAEQSHATSETSLKAPHVHRYALYHPSFGQTLRSVKQDRPEASSVPV